MFMEQIVLPERMMVKAVQVARRIHLRRFPSQSALAVSPMFFPHGQGYVVLFRYGVIVFINIEPLDQRNLIDNTLGQYLGEAVAGGEEEMFEVTTAAGQEERVLGDTIQLRDYSLARMQLLAEMMARSVLLAGYETRINQGFDLVEPMAEQLAASRGARSPRKLLQTIGTALATEHDMVGRAAVTEKPDLLWEHSELEGLYMMLEVEFELRERDSALARKVDLVSRTAQTALELLHTRRSLRVEWYIVILIVFEILLTLFEMFVRSG
jgi:required for meiotic nuclear division protein 1